MWTKNQKVMHDNLLKYINNNTTIVTPNRRLAINLRQEFDLCQKNSGKNAWPSIDILPISSWIKRTWQDCCSDKILLNEHQTRVIWQNIIADSANGKLLLNKFKNSVISEIGVSSRIS